MHHVWSPSIHTARPIFEIYGKFILTKLDALTSLCGHGKVGGGGEKTRNGEATAPGNLLEARTLCALSCRTTDGYGHESPPLNDITCQSPRFHILRPIYWFCGWIEIQTSGSGLLAMLQNVGGDICFNQI